MTDETQKKTSEEFYGKGRKKAMRNRTTLLRAEQSRAWDNCAIFALETEYNIRDG